MSFKSIVRDYFIFNKRERNGVFILLIIITLLLLFLSLSDFFFHQQKIDFSSFENEITSLEMEEPYSVSNDSPEDNIQSNNNNHFSKRVFVGKHMPAVFKKAEQNVSVELNSADTTELKKLRGIGSAFAKRIIKYREILGGYITKEQLLEVYGFDKEKYEMVAPHVFTDSTLVKKININACTEEQLKIHPYIKWKLASVIINYRKNHGNYSSVESVKNIGIISDSALVKILPYLSIQ